MTQEPEHQEESTSTADEVQRLYQQIEARLGDRESILNSMSQCELLMYHQLLRNYHQSLVNEAWLEHIEVLSHKLRETVEQVQRQLHEQPPGHWQQFVTMVGELELTANRLANLGYP